jgi:serine/threonine protein kinase
MTVPFSLSTSYTMLEDIILGMAYLHYLGITHRDLKLMNILYIVKPEFSLKICDFGVSKEIMTECEISHTVVGTPGFQAPEVCGALKYNRRCDVWTFGVGASKILGNKEIIPEDDWEEDYQEHKEYLNSQEAQTCADARKFARRVFYAKEFPELFDTISWKAEDRPEFRGVMGLLLMWKARKGLSTLRINPLA